jgi:hypothetical protein
MLHYRKSKVNKTFRKGRKMDNKWYAGYIASRETWQIFKAKLNYPIEDTGYDAVSRPFESKEELLEVFRGVVE